MREFDIIRRYFAPIARAFPGALDLRDDAALIAPPAGRELVITADALVAGVHFFAHDPAGAIAQKALRVNLSDLAAKGAEPLGFLLTCALPRGLDEPWIAAFAQGLAEDASTFACPLMGGDTTATPGPLSLSITALGSVPKGAMLTRSGARAGDLVCVSGTLGDAALGLLLRQNALETAEETHRAFLLDRYLLPQPRLALGRNLRGLASACMDLSDGLAGDILRLCEASGLGAHIETAEIPLSAAAREAVKAAPERLSALLQGGDDYELLFTLPPKHLPAAHAEAARAGCTVHSIGTMRETKEGVRFSGYSQPLAGYEHFRANG